MRGEGIRARIWFCPFVPTGAFSEFDDSVVGSNGVFNRALPSENWVPVLPLRSTAFPIPKLLSSVQRVGAPTPPIGFDRSRTDA